MYIYIPLITCDKLPYTLYISAKHVAPWSWPKNVWPKNLGALSNKYINIMQLVGSEIWLY